MEVERAHPSSAEQEHAKRAAAAAEAQVCGVVGRWLVVVVVGDDDTSGRRTNGLGQTMGRKAQLGFQRYIMWDVSRGFPPLCFNISHEII